MSAGLDFSPKSARFAAAAIVLAVTTAATAQDAADPSNAPNSASALRLPENPQIFGSTMPSVIKATAIVNGEVITQTDVAQRLMLLAIAEEGQLPADQVEVLRQQVLRNLIDEVLQIQAAKRAEITVTDKDIDKTLERVASNVKMTPAQLTDFLKSQGSSIRTLRKQIEGEIAWRRLQQQKIESSVNVGEELPALAALPRQRLLVLVFLYGGNDGFNVEAGGQLYGPHDPEWQTEYARRVAVVMRELSQNGKRPVYWVPPPTARTAPSGRATRTGSALAMPPSRSWRVKGRISRWSSAVRYSRASTRTSSKPRVASIHDASVGCARSMAPSRISAER